MNSDKTSREKFYEKYDEIILIKEDEIIEDDLKKIEYIKTINDKYFVITEGFRYISHIKTYLSCKLSDDLLSRFKIEGLRERNYYKYHLENFYIRSISIIDYIVLFTNHILRTGVPERKCSIYSITENTNYKNSEITSILKKINTEFMEIRSERNGLIHKGAKKSHFFDDLDDFSYWKQMTKSIPLLKNHTNLEQVNDLMNNLIKHIEEKTNTLEELFEELFGELLNDIDKNVKFIELEK